MISTTRANILSNKRDLKYSERKLLLDEVLARWPYSRLEHSFEIDLILHKWERMSPFREIAGGEDYASGYAHIWKALERAFLNLNQEFRNQPETLRGPVTPTRGNFIIQAGNSGRDLWEKLPLSKLKEYSQKLSDRAITERILYLNRKDQIEFLSSYFWFRMTLDRELTKRLSFLSHSEKEGELLRERRMNRLQRFRTRLRNDDSSAIKLSDRIELLYQAALLYTEPSLMAAWYRSGRSLSPGSWERQFFEDLNIVKVYVDGPLLTVLDLLTRYEWHHAYKKEVDLKVDPDGPPIQGQFVTAEANLHREAEFVGRFWYESLARIFVFFRNPVDRRQGRPRVDSLTREEIGALMYRQGNFFSNAVERHLRLSELYRELRGSQK